MGAIEAIAPGAKKHIVCLGGDAWLIAYDIRDPHRLGRVYRLLRSRGLRLQYSVFLAWLGKNDLQNLVETLQSIIDERCDDVRLYHLPASVEVCALGKCWLPDGVDLYQNGQVVGFPPLARQDNV